MRCIAQHDPCVACCRYKPFLVAEVKLNDPSTAEGSNIDPAAADKGSAFKQLAGFLGKKNERGQELSMTTPVFNKSKQGVMQFYIGEGYKVSLRCSACKCCLAFWRLIRLLLLLCRDASMMLLILQGNQTPLECPIHTCMHTCRSPRLLNKAAQP